MLQLTCPNCGAQYEVPDEVIPTSGRDVQCSNCGDTWFQHHPDHVPEPQTAEPAEAEWDAPSEPEAPQEEDTEEQFAVSEDADEDIAEEISDGIADDISAETQDARDEQPAARRELDPTVADVLREEAELERAARASDTGESLETQPELGLSETLDDAAKRSAEAEARMARLRGDVVDDIEGVADGVEPDIEPDPGNRRDLLPDIDEINSSLDSDLPSSGTGPAAGADEIVAA